MVQYIGSLSIRIMQTHLFYQQNCNYPNFRLEKIVSLLLPSHNLHQMSQCSVFKVHPELSLNEIFNPLTISINTSLLEKWWAKVDLIFMAIILRFAPCNRSESKCSLCFIFSVGKNGGPKWTRTTDLTIISRVL